MAKLVNTWKRTFLGLLIIFSIKVIFSQAKNSITDMVVRRSLITCKIAKFWCHLHINLLCWNNRSHIYNSTLHFSKATCQSSFFFFAPTRNYSFLIALNLSLVISDKIRPVVSSRTQTLPLKFENWRIQVKTSMQHKITAIKEIKWKLTFYWEIKVLKLQLSSSELSFAQVTCYRF